MSDRKVRNNFTHYHREAGVGEPPLLEFSYANEEAANLRDL
jgi:hypothetical protein